MIVCSLPADAFIAVGRSLISGPAELLDLLGRRTSIAPDIREIRQSGARCMLPRRFVVATRPAQIPSIFIARA
jgi:hypothetical protein